MKRVSCLLVCLMVCCLSTLGFAEGKLPSIKEFEPLFESAAKLLGSGHEITTDNLTSSSGKVRTTFNVKLSDVLTLMVQIRTDTHETCDVIATSKGGNTSDSTDFLCAISEILYCTEGIDDVSKTGDFLELLGFFDNLKDGDSNSIEVNGITYSYLVSSMFGFIFSASIPIE